MNRYRSVSHDSDNTEGEYELDLDLDQDQEYTEDEGARRLPQLPSAHLDPSDISFIRSFLRLVLVICTVLVAAFIPNIGLLVSLAGATSGTSLALIFPPLLEVCITRQQRVSCMSKPRWLFCVVSMGIGVIGAILGTLISLNDIYYSMNN